MHYYIPLVLMKVVIGSEQWANICAKMDSKIKCYWLINLLSSCPWGPATAHAIPCHQEGNLKCST